MALRYRQVIRCLATGKVQFIHVTEKVTMMQAQVKAPVGAFGKGDRHPRHARGVVKGRSRQAQKRLLWEIAQVGHLFRYGCWLVTLTHGKHAPDWEESKRLFAHWKSNVVRSVPQAFALWVAESQTRGAPHYHLLMGGVAPSVMTALKGHWLAICGDEGSRAEDREKYAFDAQVYGENQTDAAVEKYLVKVCMSEVTKSRQQDSEVHTGRTWGRINKALMRMHAAQVDFLQADPEKVGEWLKERAMAGLKRAGVNAGAGAVTDHGEFVKLCYASTVEFSTNAREFIDEAQAQGPW